ncbi:hypothetical protein Tco_1274875 [Tanacetum coccineum]
MGNEKMKMYKSLGKESYRHLVDYTQKLMMHYFPQLDFFNRMLHMALSEGAHARLLVVSYEDESSLRGKGKANSFFVSMMMEGRRWERVRLVFPSSDGECRGKGERGRARARALCFIVPMKGELREKSKALYLLIPIAMEGERRGEGGRGSGVQSAESGTNEGDTGEKGRTRVMNNIP